MRTHSSSRTVHGPCISVLALMVLVGGFAACGSTDSSGAPDSPTSASTPFEPRLNEVQVVGTHNSYHVALPADVLAALDQFAPETSITRGYSHPLLANQLDAGIRQIELDVFADPEGGLYAEPFVSGFPGTPAPDPALQNPGFKVLHQQDVDYASNCPTFVACLEDVRDWSAGNPDHLPIGILVQVNDEPIQIEGTELSFTVPAPVGEAELQALDTEIFSVFLPDQIITPDDVKGDHATLAEAIAEEGWPLLDDVRGKVLFALDNTGPIKDDYLAGSADLEGRPMFVDSRPGDSYAAFAKLNDPVAKFDNIQDLVAKGFLVRTRADADTLEARANDRSRADDALSSGAQWVSTDYPQPDPAIGTDYEVSLPGGGLARCDPVSAPPECSDESIGGG